MIAFRGRSAHTVKQKNKPIDEGYKVWGLGFEGYYYDWLGYTLKSGSERCLGKRTRHFNSCGPTTTVPLADTFQVPVVLCQELKIRYPHQNYVAFLDNLFLNVPVAYTLQKIGVGVMGTTRKNAKGVLEALCYA